MKLDLKKVEVLIDAVDRKYGNAFTAKLFRRVRALANDPLLIDVTSLGVALVPIDREALEHELLAQAVWLQHAANAVARMLKPGTRHLLADLTRRPKAAENRRAEEIRLAVERNLDTLEAAPLEVPATHVVPSASPAREPEGVAGPADPPGEPIPVVVVEQRNPKPLCQCQGCRRRRHQSRIMAS